MNRYSPSARVLSPDEVIDHLGRVDGSGDQDWLRTIFAAVLEHPRWRLVRLPLDCVKFGDERDRKTVDYYASLSVSTSPPIVCVPSSDGRYETIDGEHRAQAAYLRGDDSVLAFVPVEA